MYKKCFQQLIVLPVVLFLLIFMISGGGLCFGDWDESDGHKMHYPQLPDLSPSGMDVLAGPLSVPDGMPPYEIFLADDFKCSQDGAITSIHIWGSYNQDRPLHLMNGWPSFSLVIYSDIPADPDVQGSYSMPGEVLWQTYMPATAIREYSVGHESFYDPIFNHIIGMDTMCWQYNFVIPEDIAFVQEEGTIYWLGIHYSFDLNQDGVVDMTDLMMFSSTYPGMFGWKTSGVEHFNDDAVFTEVMTFGRDPHTVPFGPWAEMRYPFGHPKELESIDLAFVINGEGLPPDDLDFGDAPDSYGTKLPTGANHIIGGPWLGNVAPDSEPDGLPSILADGDDLDMAVDDEDGVSVAMLTIGQTNIVNITVSGGGGSVAGWFDWDQNGTFDIGEQEVASFFPVDGTYPVAITPPASAVAGNTYARFRITSSSVIPSSPTGQLPDGEVEDYFVIVEEFFEIKWEQLPDLSLSGTHAHDYGDPAAGSYTQIIIADDWICEGGVVTDFHWWGFEEAPGAGLGGFHVSIHANSPLGCLPADPAIWEKDVPLSDITVTWMGSYYRYDYYLQPEDYFYQTEGETYWFDLSALSVDPIQACLWIWLEHANSVLCPAADKIEPTRPVWIPTNINMAFRVTSDSSLPMLDWGDAPDFAGALGYPTLAANNGARHIIAGPWLGDMTDVPDGEGNGQPTLPSVADGDDIDGNDDEDGVAIPAMNQGIPTAITLEVNGGGGFVDAWIDWNQNNIWEASEQIHNAFFPDGTHNISVLPAIGVTVGQTFARFRISTAGGLPPDGPADDGEVEDHLVRIGLGPQADLGDAPDSSNTAVFPMTAYFDGTAANFPSVFFAGSPPHGPKHIAPKRSAWLGQNVTLENEADSGLDQDSINNIVPSLDLNDLDGADDGLVLPVNMPKCRWTNVDYQVTAPATGGVYYVNIWCDFNRDGDWDDQIAGCSMGDVPEWAVRNQMLTGLPAGLNTIKSLPFVSWHPIDAPEELWVRITISEQIWQEAWGSGGCGPASGYAYAVGETEDYLVVPDTSCVACADLNCNNFVDLADFAIFASQWLTTCP